MKVKLEIPFDLRTTPTAAQLVAALAPLVPTPVPQDLTATITGINLITLSYTTEFATPLDAATWLLTLNNERLPAWYAKLYSPPSP